MEGDEVEDSELLFVTAVVADTDSELVAEDVDESVDDRDGAMVVVMDSVDVDVAEAEGAAVCVEFVVPLVDSVGIALADTEPVPDTDCVAVVVPLTHTVVVDVEEAIAVPVTVVDDSPDADAVLEDRKDAELVCELESTAVAETVAVSDSVAADDAVTDRVLEMVAVEVIVTVGVSDVVADWDGEPVADAALVTLASPLPVTEPVTDAVAHTLAVAVMDESRLLVACADSDASAEAVELCVA